MRVLLVGGALTLIFLSALLFLVGERSAGGRSPSKGRFSVIGHVTGDFAGAPWAGAVAKLDGEQVLIPPDGRFSFLVPPGRYSIEVCCSTEFQAINEIIDVVDRDIQLTLVAQPLLEISGTVTVSGDVPSLQGFAISASLRGTNVVGSAVTDTRGNFTLHLREGDWLVTVDNLPEGYGKPEMNYGENRLADNVLVLGAAARSASLRIELKAAER